ncbi:MAG: prepilin-type N-terminal cleavage/methylation domain-containing protein [Planctomycetota bacterium]
MARRGCRAKERGFTLVEIMVVVVIVGMLAAVVSMHVFGSQDRAFLTRVRADFATLREACGCYRLAHGAWPEDLSLLHRAEDGGRFIEQEARDPWGVPYRLEGLTEAGDPRLVCAGADRQYDTEDDLDSETVDRLDRLPRKGGP